MVTPPSMVALYNGYTVTVTDAYVLEMRCEACNALLLALPSAYLSYFTRTAETHAQVCAVVNRQGAHSAVR